MSRNLNITAASSQTVPARFQTIGPGRCAGQFRRWRSADGNE